jgi:hypothetical protein
MLNREVLICFALGMQNKQSKLSDRAEAAVVDQIVVRLIEPHEQGRWNRLVGQHHYLKNAHLVGERMCYVVEHGGRWLALLGWSAAAYHVGPRDRWIGWSDNQRRARLRLLANHARFCLLTQPGEYPNLASRAMALNLARLSQDWQETYGHPIVLVESFVDSQLFGGTAYKASGWRELGRSSGFRRVAQDFYKAHPRPKQLYVRETVPHAARKLRHRRLPQGLEEHEQKIDRSCPMPGEELLSFWQTPAPASARKPRWAGPAPSASHGAHDHLGLFAQRRPRRPSCGGRLGAGLKSKTASGGALLVQPPHQAL